MGLPARWRGDGEPRLFASFFAHETGWCLGGPLWRDDEVHSRHRPRRALIPGIPARESQELRRAVKGSYPGYFYRVK